MTRDTTAAVIAAVACHLLQTAGDIKRGERRVPQELRAAINKLQAILHDMETPS